MSTISNVVEREAAVTKIENFRNATRVFEAERTLLQKLKILEEVFPIEYIQRHGYYYFNVENSISEEKVGVLTTTFNALQYLIAEKGEEGPYKGILFLLDQIASLQTKRGSKKIPTLMYNLYEWDKTQMTKKDEPGLDG